MFDSAPSNLPFEPAQKPNVQGQASVVKNSALSDGQRVTESTRQGLGGKEPEDIFAGIKEPTLIVANNRSAVPQTPIRTKSGSKILVLVSIPSVVVALGVGGWYLYGSLTQGSGVNLSQQKSFEATVPSSSEPDNMNKTLQNPMPEPDDSQLAASQASVGILRAQQEQALASGTSPVMSATSAEQVVNIPVVSGQEAGSVAEIDETPQNLVTGQGVGSTNKGVDEDQDGLSDAEEALLGINSKSKDSDSDGFEDLSEVKNGYDPATVSGKLENSPYIKKETIGSLEMMMPKVWVKKAGPNNSIVLDTGTPITITIAMEQFASTQTLLAWLLEKYPGSLQEDYVQDTAKNGETVIYSKDGTRIWLLSGNTIYSVRYATNGLTDEFRELLDVMVKQALQSK